MIVVRREVTAGELLCMPDDGARYELVRGELRKMAPAGNVHGRVAMNFGIFLGTHVKAQGLGAVFAAGTGFRLHRDPDTVRAPDMAFISRERLAEVGETEGYWPGAPDLAVEVVSPSDVYVEVEEKVFGWLDAGAKMVAVVNSRRRSVTVYRSRTEISVLTGDDVMDGDDVVPGFRLAVRELFAWPWWRRGWDGGHFGFDVGDRRSGSGFRRGVAAVCEDPGTAGAAFSAGGFGPARSADGRG